MDIPMSSVRATVAIMFGVVVPILWVLPGLFLLARSALSSRRAAPPIASSTATRAASSADASDKLAAAESAARKLRMRVGGLTAQLGWMMLVVSMTVVCTALFTSVNLTPLLGQGGFYLAMMSWGCGLMVLTLRPIDAKAIGFACIFFFCFSIFGAGIFVFMVVQTAYQLIFLNYSLSLHLSSLPNFRLLRNTSRRLRPSHGTHAQVLVLHAWQGHATSAQAASCVAHGPPLLERRRCR